MKERIDFVKMHGLGNDFVIIDSRKKKFLADSRVAKRIANRQQGIGCDQLIIIHDPDPIAQADCMISIYNSDGSEITACGNATRCVAALLMEEKGVNEVTIQTPSAREKPLHCYFASKRNITVNMGEPRFKSREFSFPEDTDVLHLKIGRENLQDPVAVNMGNPHCVFIVKDCEEIDLARLGPIFESHPYFPNRVNVGVVEIIDQENLKLRVWERGSGETLACGTGACAALTAAHKRGLIGRKVMVHARGGELFLDWKDENNIYLTGPVSKSFKGYFESSLIE